MKKLITQMGSHFTSSLGRFYRDERGITGLETAIILIAFVVVAAVFSFTILSTGLFSSEKAKEAILVGLQKTRSTMELRGSVVAETDIATGTVAKVRMVVANAAAGDGVLLDPDAINNTTILAYTDADQHVSDLAYTVTWLVQTTDNKILEPGEVAEIMVDLSTLTTKLGTNKPFTIEIKPSQGGVMNVARRTPPDLTSPKIVELF